jgi:hypothetical protein
VADQLDLFAEDDDQQPEKHLAAVVTRKSRAGAGWQLAPHACRFCFGRVLQRTAGGVVVQVRCAECGAGAMGSVDQICACGAGCGDIGYVLKCVRNPQVTKENPHEVLIREVPRATQEREQQVQKTVRLNEF